MIFGFADTSGGGIVSLETVAKLINLLIFVALAVYFLRRPLSEKLQERREGIRRALMRAQEERDAAQAKLAEVEERLGRLDAEVEAMRVQARREAEEERRSSDRLRRMRSRYAARRNAKSKVFRRRRGQGCGPSPRSRVFVWPRS